MTREVCDLCDRESRVGFTVPYAIWERVRGTFPVELSIDILCLACFTQRADLLNLEWDRDIRFWPVSKVTFKAAATDIAKAYLDQVGEPG